MEDGSFEMGSRWIHKQKLKVKSFIETKKNGYMIMQIGVKMVHIWFTGNLTHKIH